MCRQFAIGGRGNLGKRCPAAWAVPVLLLVSTLAATAGAAVEPVAPRRSVNLDGTWQIEQGALDRAPQTFGQTVVVPGLVDMAQPGFKEVGQKSSLRQAFWYRRSFAVEGPLPAVAILKIHKARYGTKVILNGRTVGEHLPCFTPALLDVAPYLKGSGQPNELLIRIGADRESLPADVPTG